MIQDQQKLIERDEFEKKSSEELYEIYVGLFNQNAQLKFLIDNCHLTNMGLINENKDLKKQCEMLSS
jgi:hypothetical protein